VRPEAQYFEFSMAASVQGWRTKWFYIKDRKSSPEDNYGLPPFDASQEVKKLASWDMLPSDAEVEQILPLLSRIKAIKALQGGQGGALSGIQLMAFFVQRRVQPLQHRLTKLWTYSGLEDPTRISKDLIEKKDVDKRVRSLTKEHAVADLTADFFDSVHPLPEVCIPASTFRQTLLGFDLALFFAFALC
jgi:hypothetical protein